VPSSAKSARTRTISTARMMGGGEVNGDVQRVHGEVILLSLAFPCTAHPFFPVFLLFTALFTLHVQTGPYSSSCSGMTACGILDEGM
jgi:hypothetical protein